MSRETLPPDLSGTITATWLRQLAGPHGTRAHWLTKMQYYRAAADLLRDRPGSRLAWRDVVDAVSPRGSRSTFYEVTGPGSKHALMNEFLASGRVDALQIAFTFRRDSAVDQLIDETKVWSYWPTRERWANGFRAGDLDVAVATKELLTTVGQWARDEPDIAVALDHAPPACAVEDLIWIHGGHLPAMRALASLRSAMIAAMGTAADPHQVDFQQPVPVSPRAVSRTAPTDAGTLHEAMFVLVAEAIGRTA